MPGGFPAHDEIETAVGLSRRHAGAGLAGRHFHDAPDRHRDRVLAGLRQQIHLCAEIEIADIVAAPPLVRVGITRDDATDLLVVDEDREKVAINAGVEQEGPEDLGSVLDAHRQGAGEIADVGEALGVVGAAAISADRPFTGREHLGSGYKPQPGVALKSRRGRSCIVGHCLLRTGLRACADCCRQQKHPRERHASKGHLSPPKPSVICVTPSCRRSFPNLTG